MPGLCDKGTGLCHPLLKRRNPAVPCGPDRHGNNCRGRCGCNKDSAQQSSLPWLRRSLFRIGNAFYPCKGKGNVHVKIEGFLKDLLMLGAFGEPFAYGFHFLGAGFAKEVPVQNGFGDIHFEYF